MCDDCITSLLHIITLLVLTIKIFIIIGEASGAGLNMPTVGNCKISM